MRSACAWGLWRPTPPPFTPKMMGWGSSSTSCPLCSLQGTPPALTVPRHSNLLAEVLLWCTGLQCWGLNLDVLCPSHKKGCLPKLDNYWRGPADILEHDVTFLCVANKCCTCVMFCYRVHVQALNLECECHVNRKVVNLVFAVSELLIKEELLL